MRKKIVAMNKIINIFQAWLKTFGIIKTTRDERRMQVERLEICKGCEFAKKSKTLEAIRGEVTEVNILFCEHCKCSLQEKTLIKNEKCPIEKWKGK